MHTKTTGQKRTDAQYQLYLEKRRYDKSKVWKSLRDVKLESTDYKCEICDEQSEVMQVHHLTYVRCGGKELMEDLQSVCKECHGAIHGYRKPIKVVEVDQDEINRNKVLDMMNAGDVYWESFHRIYGFA
jgi:uncharacterized protein with PIN domain